MTMFYSNAPTIEASLKSDKSSAADKIFKKALGTTRLHTRVGRFVCVVSDNDVFAGEVYEDEPNYENADRATRNKRLKILNILHEKIGKKHPLRRKLLAAIDREEDQHSRWRWFVIGTSGSLMLGTISPRASEKEATAELLKSMGRKRMIKGTRLELRMIP